MKKILYFILLIAELFVGVLFMSALWNSSLYIPIAIAVVALAALLSWMITLLTKTDDIVRKRKILLGIALSMLVPIAVFVITFFVVAVAFIIAFSN